MEYSSMAAKQLPISSYKRVIAICCAVAFGGFQYGFDNQAIAGMQAMVGFLKVFGYEAPELPLGWNITPKVQQLISSFMLLGSLVGSFLSGPIGQKFGRRAGLLAAIVTSFIAISVMIGTTSVGALYFARILLGISNGLFNTFCLLYLSEASPPHLRGAVVAGFQLFLVAGSVLGAVVDNYTAVRVDRLAYQIPLIVLYVVPVLLAFLILWLPDSPRWLVENGRVEDAKSALHKLQGPNVPENVITEQLNEIDVAIKAEKAIGKVAFLDLFRGTDLRRTLLSVAAIMFQAGSGALFISIFATFYFALGGLSNPFQSTIILLCVGFIGNLQGVVLSRYVGRRPLLIYGPLISGLCLIGIGIAFTVNPIAPSSGRALVGLSCVYLWAYNSSTGPFAYVVGAEVPSQRLRSWTVGVGMSVGFVFGWLCIFTSPYFINPAGSSYIGLKTCYIWGASNVVMGVFAVFFIPETKDRSLEEIDEMFMVGLPAWKFKDYVCTGIGARHVEKNGSTSNINKGDLHTSTRSVSPVDS